ncbi:MAG TPA: Ig-like domain-containing protein [Kofleriaceae bacterium]
MTRLVCVLVIAACGSVDDKPMDTMPPSVVAIAPADGATGVWLHDPIRISFSEPVTPTSLTGVRILGPVGEPLPATAALEGDSVIVVQIDPAVAVVGSVRIELGEGVTDAAGNALGETSAGWTVSPWVHGPEVAGTTPAVAIGSDGRIAVAHTVLLPGGRRVAVRLWDGATWIELGGMLGTRDAALPSVVYGGSQPIVVWSELGTTPTIEAARWTGTEWQPIVSPGEGSFVVASALPGSEPVIAYTAPSAFGVGTVLRTKVLAGETWQPVGFDVAVNGGVVGLPQLALTGPARPAVAFVDARTVRTLTWNGAAWTEAPSIPLAPVPAGQFNRVAIAARGATVVLAYDTYEGSFGVHAVEITGTTVRPLGGALDVDPSANAQAPAVAIDADGAPLVAWRENIDGNWRGVLARWGATGWVSPGGHVWSGDPTRSLVRPAIALHRDRVPVVAWFESTDTVRVARFNGPGEAPLRTQRSSIVGCSFDGTAQTLSATGCFTIVNGTATPHAGLIPFDLRSELWSDGALKRRWLALPDGQMMKSPVTGAWDAPAGSMILKEFAIETTPGNSRTRRVMETRFLVLAAGTWRGYSFRWRADGKDADLLPDAPTTAPWPLDNGTQHVHSYPSRAQCARCHSASNGPLLGLRTAQLARRVDDNGVIVDQLAALQQLGVIGSQIGAGPPLGSPHDSTVPLELRVRGYLAANCSHCHNPLGERPTRDFRWETPLAQTMLCGPDNEVVKGNPAASMLFQRMSTRTGGMPPLATLQVDPIAIDVVSRWILSETNCD